MRKSSYFQHLSVLLTWNIRSIITYNSILANLDSFVNFWKVLGLVGCQVWEVTGCKVMMVSDLRDLDKPERRALKVMQRSAEDLTTLASTGHRLFPLTNIHTCNFKFNENVDLGLILNDFIEISFPMEINVKVKSNKTLKWKSFNCFLAKTSLE